MVVPRAWQEDKPKSVDEEDFSGELPRIPATEPDQVGKTFEVQDGFRIELVAAEPLVNSPVAASWDEDGRLYVVEMKGYSENRDDALGTVRRLEDRDGDGIYDAGTVFADKLLWPTAVTCWQGGIFVGDAPDIFYLKDTNGDGVADEKSKVFTGFSIENVQGLLNSFTWSLDNRIHGSASSTGGAITRPDDPNAPPISIRGRDFEFDPRNFQLIPTSGGAQHGLTFDAWGRKFVCHNSDHIQQVMYEDHYLARNPFFSSPGPRISIAADGPQAEVYRISPVEPWRIVRTRLRVAGKVPGPVEGGGRAAGYFTSATGVTIYNGDAWPKEWSQTAIVGDVGSNIVHRKKLTQNGLIFTAERIDKESEFIASRDNWFRPAQFANGPDGALYVIDVYREVIEHPASIPPVIKRHLDLTSGRDRGRIYRIVPADFKSRRTPRLSRATTAELVGLLSHENQWHRTTASRLIYERADRASVPLLEQLVARGESPLGRMHGLYALAGQNALTTQVLLAGLQDPHPRVREHAIRVSERTIPLDPLVTEALLKLAEDDDPAVRYQLAFTLGAVDDARRVSALVQIAARATDPIWTAVAVQSSAKDIAGDILVRACSEEALRQNPAALGLLQNLARQVGVQGNTDQVAQVLQAIEQISESDRGLAQGIVLGLSEGLANQNNPLKDRLVDGSAGEAAKLLNELLTDARAKAADESAALDSRASAIRTLSLGKFSDAQELLTSFLDLKQPDALQFACINCLSRFQDDRVAGLLIGAWPSMSPRLKTQATEVLFGRPERVQALFNAIDGGELSINEIDVSRLRLIAQGNHPELKSRAERLLASTQQGRRQDVVNAYAPALKKTADLERGKAVFKKICSACHRAEGLGFEIGPNLATMKNRGPESILLNVLDPSREVNPQYLNYVINTVDGVTYTGLVASETATGVTLRRAENQTQTVLRVEIDEFRSTGLSIMPEGLEKEIDQQAMADVIAYVLSLK